MSETGVQRRSVGLGELLAETTELRLITRRFSPRVFSISFGEWRRFFRRGGILKVLCFPAMDEADLKAVTRGWMERASISASAVPNGHASPEAGRNLLIWGIANSQIYLRLVVNEAERGCFEPGVIGIGIGEAGEEVGFFAPDGRGASGSDEIPGIQREGRDDNGRKTITKWGEKFREIWDKESVVPTALPIHRGLAKGYLRTDEGHDDEVEVEQSEAPRVWPSGAGRFAEMLMSPPELKLRDYQEAAVESWFDEGGTGIYAMATGTGKTITSLSTAVRLYNQVGGPLVVIVVVPYLVLLEQWLETMRWFGLSPIECCGSRSSWVSSAHAVVRLANRGRREVASFVVSNKTFTGEPFQNLLRRLKCRTMLIADEVHNFGARNLRKSLPEHVSLRLGLSATPERHNDPKGTAAIFEYFGGPVIRFGMKEAMATKPPALVPYGYNPVLVELTREEYAEYHALTKKVGKALASKPEQDVLSNSVKMLLIRRARIVGAAENKLQALEEKIKPYQDATHTLVYCGDGSVELGVDTNEETGQFQRQIEAVVDRLGNGLGMDVASYTAATPKSERKRILEDFEAGRLQALVAIRCLDEGLDVPKVRRAFILASSSNPRQFIQRRGRVLRRAPGKDSAEIFDLFAVPPTNEEFESRDVQRSLVRSEMKRAVEFMRLATNEINARSKLWDVLKRLRLLDTLTGEDDG